ncbi:hypothetical protein AnigIFM63604_007065 [Aspergillus niger]|uniref:N-acetylgalactosaminide beta-1,3-galactosyltransferase n=1 Tax=Aspergillus niger TaxID=5061 RepID=A0A9W6A2N0_ASPNG|nr:hypothetical protein CBS11350_10788 [Aspergillus niger]KAI2940432.1 hypothetical protein CBS147322_9753 [Aspergillus niger]KAI2977801.1 hypothetical protein CBS147482_10591 [Aspergillus niger]KAI2989481.1 hypothetical protein CBS147344_3001 [Aspergillus niger]GLA50750.1 hypothetical protein AnigIFM63604_007065 [Aspergillus niger]
MPRRRLILVAALIALGLLYTLSSHGASSPPLQIIPDDCPSRPDLDNILVVLKTGVTESRTKVPIHLSTTLRCIPNHVLFSDYVEQLSPNHFTHDVLASLSPALLNHNPELDLYRRVRAEGPAALTPADLNPDVNTPIGKPNNPGWKLDKWKFLPMLDEALRVKPDASWYIFLEADTYLVWDNFLQWLRRFDPSKPWYLGNQMQIVDAIFAHGGSGFALSRPALVQAVNQRKRTSDGWERAVAEHWAGDCMLGILLENVGVDLTWSWPMLQIAPPEEMDYFSIGYAKRPWCYPAVSFHHLDEQGIRQLDDLERQLGPLKTPLLYRDVFLKLVRPELRDVRTEWDNLVDGDPVAVSSFAACRGVCTREAKCLQYAYNATEGACRTSTVLALGHARPGLSAGWMTERIDAMAESLGECREISWID